MWKWYYINDSTLMATRLSFSCMLSQHQMISHFQYANKWRRPVVTCWRQGRPMNEVISLEHGLIAVMHLSVVCPIPPIPGNWHDCPIGQCPHTLATILHVYHPHPTYLKYPISPCCAQCVTGRYGYLRNSQIKIYFSKTLTQQKRIHYAIWVDWD